MLIFVAEKRKPMQAKDQHENIFLPYGCYYEPEPGQPANPVFCHGCAKLDVFDWLNNYTSYHSPSSENIVEVRFKNSRKDFFLAPDEVKLVIGDIVAVEASPGHDVGVVSLTGILVHYQLKKKNINPNKFEFKKVYRTARSSDIEKWIAATSLEKSTMQNTRIIVSDLGLAMKINDVEYQGDKTKAIFYYTAADRVDFRELIKILAEKFSVRIEMKQIGVRQEAARVGGIGSCGRELCCATWLTNFTSVSTNTARSQQLSLNPQKLAGQCGKLKCCLNYEYDCYFDKLSNFPNNNIVLKTKKGDAVHHKTDIHKGIMWYMYKNETHTQIPILYTDVKKIIAMNKNNKLPSKLEDFEAVLTSSKEAEMDNDNDNYFGID